MARDTHIGERLTEGIVFVPETGQLEFPPPKRKEVTDHLKDSLNSVIAILRDEEINTLGNPAALPLSIRSTKELDCHGFTIWTSEKGVLCTASVETTNYLGRDSTKFCFTRRYNEFLIEMTLAHSTGDKYPKVVLAVRNAQINSESLPALLKIEVFEGHVKGMTIPDLTAKELEEVFPKLDLHQLRHHRQYREKQLAFLRNQLFFG